MLKLLLLYIFASWFNQAYAIRSSKYAEINVKQACLISYWEKVDKSKYEEKRLKNPQLYKKEGLKYYRTKVVCSGAIVGKHSVITAEHCRKKAPKVEGVVQTTVRCHGDEKERKVATSTQPIDLDWDMALYHVEKPFDIEPMKVLYDKKRLKVLLERGLCYVAGYGVDNNGKSGIYHAAKVDSFTIDPMSIFDLGAKHDNSVAFGGRYLNHGDSGGPLVCKNGHDLVIAGVHSKGSEGINDFSETFVGMEHWLKYALTIGSKYPDDRFVKEKFEASNKLDCLYKCAGELAQIHGHAISINWFLQRYYWLETKKNRYDRKSELGEFDEGIQEYQRLQSEIQSMHEKCISKVKLFSN